MTRDSTRDSALEKAMTRDSARVTRDSTRDSTVMTRAQLCNLSIATVNAVCFCIVICAQLYIICIQLAGYCKVVEDITYIINKYQIEGRS